MPNEIRLCLVWFGIRRWPDICRRYASIVEFVMIIASAWRPSVPRSTSRRVPSGSNHSACSIHCRGRCTAHSIRLFQGRGNVHSTRASSVPSTHRNDPGIEWTTLPGSRGFPVRSCAAQSHAIPACGSPIRGRGRRQRWRCFSRRGALQVEAGAACENAVPVSEAGPSTTSRSASASFHLWFDDSHGIQPPVAWRKSPPRRCRR